MQRRHKLIRQEVRERGITQLLHFSPGFNAESILEHGLMSRADLGSRGIEYMCTDAWLDHDEPGISTSIHTVNKPMLDKKRKCYDGEWVIWALDASVLWTHECSFFPTNAANREMGRSRFRGGHKSFLQMFDGATGKTPADIQAEVQVMEPISPELIIGIGVRSGKVKDAVEAHLREIGRPIEVNVLEWPFTGE